MKSALTLNPYPFPQRITIELSSCCNLSCTMCPRKYLSGDNGFMDKELFKKILCELQGQDVAAVVPFFRGESLLHPDFIEMMRFLRDRTKAEIQLATNALLLTEDMSHALLSLGLHFISFSLDALTRETYEKIRLGGDFDLAVNNVHAFLNLRDSLPSSVTSVQVSATENIYNREELPAFIDYWQRRVDRVRIYPQHSDGGHYGKINEAKYRRDVSSRKPCMKPFTDIVIHYDGQIALCNHDWDPNSGQSLGSIVKHSIHDIWHGDLYQSVREKHLHQQWHDVLPCNHCDHWVAAGGQESIIGNLIT